MADSCKKVFIKELQSCFQNKTAWMVWVIYVAVALAITLGQSGFFEQYESNLEYFFKIQTNLLLFVIPALTMKSWTDERKSGTLELTLSLPVSYRALVLGKFLAIWFLSCLMILTTAVFWVTTAFFIKLDNLMIINNYLVCMLMAGVLCAISLSVSVFVKHPVSAFSVSFGACFGVVLSNFRLLTDKLENVSDVGLRLANSLSFGEHLSDMIAGQITVGAIFYFVSLMTVALLINILVVCRQIKKNYMSKLVIANIIVGWMAVNIVIALIGNKYSLDFSSEKFYSLSDETKNWLKSNKHDIFMRLYVTEKVQKTAKSRDKFYDLLHLLEKYQAHSKHKISLHTIKVEPMSNAEVEAKKAGINIENGEALGLVISDEKGHFAVLDSWNEKRRAHWEHDISQVLGTLGDYKKPLIGVMSSEFRLLGDKGMVISQYDWPIIKALRNSYEVMSISEGVSVIEDDFDMVMVVNPKSMEPTAVYALDQYLMRGGNLLIFVDPLSEVSLIKNNVANSYSNLEEFLLNKGIKYHDDIVVGDNIYNRSLDKAKPIDKYPFWLKVVPNKKSHDLIRGLQPLLLNYAGYFETENDDDVIFTTSEDVGFIRSDELQSIGSEESTQYYYKQKGKKALAVLKEGEFESMFDEPIFSGNAHFDRMPPFFSASTKQGKLMVVADSDMLAAFLWNRNKQPNQRVWDNILYSGNLDFVEKSVGYLTDNNPVLNVNPKLGIYDKKSLNAVFLEKAKAQIKDELSEINEDKFMLTDEKNEILQQIRTNELLPSVKVTKKLESLERDLILLKKEERKINLDIKKDYEWQRKRYISVNFVGVVLIIGVFAWGIRLRRKKVAREFERMINE